jgi:hypothetical protein
VAEHGAEEVRPAPPPALLRDPRTQTKVDLHLLARLALHPAEWQRVDLAQPAHELLDRGVAASEAVVSRQILVDPFGGESGRNAASIWTANGTQLLGGPGRKPRAGFVAAFAAGSLAAPWAGLLAAFDSATSPEPWAGLLAAFASACTRRSCRPTVARSTPSSRAIRRRDQPREVKTMIDCWMLTLSWFITPSAKAIFAPDVN